MNRLSLQLKRLQQSGLSVARGLSWLPPLLARLTLAAVFVESGWGKLHSLGKVTAYFTSLGLPAPAFQARLVSLTEFLGGALVGIGLLTRLAACPLAVTMVVAIATAKAAEVKHLTDLAGLTEFTYLLLLLYVAVVGPGLVSLDAVLFRKVKPEDASALPAGWARKLGGGASALTAALLLGVLMWWLGASHNPCDKLPAGVHPELRSQSGGDSDEADAAQTTCRHLLEWQKAGKNPEEELRKEREESSQG